MKKRLGDLSIGKFPHRAFGHLVLSTQNLYCRPADPASPATRQAGEEGISRQESGTQLNLLFGRDGARWRISHRPDATEKGAHAGCRIAFSPLASHHAPWRSPGHRAT